jgi:CubicO group peptidase (beta-lactamase class C family)
MGRFGVRLSMFAVLIGSHFSPTAVADERSPLAARMQPFVDQHTLGGAVTLVAQHGQIVSRSAIGLADIETNRPMHSDTIFWIASMTKPITATAVMILQEEGILSVDDPAGKYLPEFNSMTLANGGAPRRPATIADLLAHMSGVANPTPDSLGRNPTLGETSAAIANQPLHFEPGSEWKYGLGLTVAGRIVEVVSGQPFDRFLEERIFRPLEMHDTTFYPTAEQRSRLATIYKLDRESKQLVPAASALNHATDQERRAPNPSGGLCSTAPDYFRFLQMIANLGELNGRRILSPTLVKKMILLRTGDLRAGHSEGMGWALGWGIVREPTGLTAALSPSSYGHGGAFGTQAWIDPQRDAVLILMIARSDMNAVQESEVRGAFATAAVAELK